MNKVDEFKAIVNKMASTYEAKNADYGDSFGKTYEELGIISAITRISDKYNRVVNLARGAEAKVKDEALEDTLLDMACYSVMTLVELEREKRAKHNENGAPQEDATQEPNC